MLCFKIVGFCSKLMVLFFPQFYSIILFADIAAPFICNYALCDDDIIGGIVSLAL